MNKQQKRIKQISEKLTKRQHLAISRALQGDYSQLITVCLECHKAEKKAEATIELGVPEWGRPTMQHYIELRQHLETFFANDDVFKAYQTILKMRD